MESSNLPLKILRTEQVTSLCIADNRDKANYLSITRMAELSISRMARLARDNTAKSHSV